MVDFSRFHEFLAPPLHTSSSRPSIRSPSSMSTPPDEDLRDVFRLLYADDDADDWAFSDDEEVGPTSFLRFIDTNTRPRSLLPPPVVMNRVTL